MVRTVFVQELQEQTHCSKQPPEVVFSWIHVFERIRGLRKEKEEKGRSENCP